jgi:hypothetical protein
MARYMARRAAALGDVQAASAFGWLAADADRDLQSSVLLEALLERTSVVAPPAAGEDRSDGDEPPSHAAIDELANLFEKSAEAKGMARAELQRLRDALQHVVDSDPRSPRR